MNTTNLMQIALDMVGFDKIPADSAIYIPGEGIKRVLFGLDIGSAELLMAKQSGYDCVIAHHPVGVPHRIWSVFEYHVDLLVAAGVPRDTALEAVEPRLTALRVSGNTRNYEQVPMAAHHLGIPFLNIHRPLDEFGRREMQAIVDRVLALNSAATLADIADVLSQQPVARRAETQVTVEMGDPSSPAGQVVIAHGALTNGGYPIAHAYFQHGIDTVIYIHIAPAELEKLRADGRGQLIITGHILGDAFGIAPYITALRKQGLEVDVLSRVLDPDD